MEGYWDREYPTHIEVPVGYWTVSVYKSEDYNPNKYWHHGEDNE